MHLQQQRPATAGRTCRPNGTAGPSAPLRAMPCALRTAGCSSGRPAARTPLTGASGTLAQHLRRRVGPAGLLRSSPSDTAAGPTAASASSNGTNGAVGTNGSASPATSSMDLATVAAMAGIAPAAVRETCETPLKAALDKAMARLAEAQQVTEALEAEAQEVAQLAVEASERRDAAKKLATSVLSEYNEAVKQQQLWADQLPALRAKVSELQAKLDALPEGAEAGADTAAIEAAREALRQGQEDLAAAVVRVKDLGRNVEVLMFRTEELNANVVVVEEAYKRAEEVAGGAMKAAEAAVKEEMEAAAVVKATQLALQKTMVELQTLQGKPAAGASTSAAESKDAAAAAAAAAATDGQVGAGLVSGAGSAASPAPTAAQSAAKSMLTMDKAISSLQSMDEAKLLELGAPPRTAAEVATAAAAAAVKAAAAPKAAPSAPAAPAPAAKKPAAVLPPALVGLFSAAVAVGLGALLLQTEPGKAALAAAQGVVATLASKMPHFHHAERAMLETICLLATSIVCVPLVVKGIPGGSPVLGYLLGGALVGPYALGFVSDVESVKHLAEMGVVFLLFNIGLELSLERLQSMAKFVFGMGTLQVVLTLLGVWAVAVGYSGMPGPAAIVLGGALAMSSTAVGIQVLEERQEMGSRHGRAIFSVLLLQDLAVVVLLMLIPLLAPSPDGKAVGLSKIFAALGTAAVKAVVCIVGIITGGRSIVRPLYKKMSNFANAEIFAATTLLVVLGTSFLTQLAGLSLALGAFLAGLLIAETEYALQVESDIAPYKGLLMGLFFMSVGMEMSFGLFVQKWQEIIIGMVLLIVGKTAVMAGVGPMFGLTQLSAIRSGLVLAPGGEFAFVAFGEAVSRGLLPPQLSQVLYLVVALSMAVLPYLAALGGKLGHMLEKYDMQALQISEAETKELRDHVIIAGYGRVGQIIAQMLSEQMIPFVSLDVKSDRVSVGKSADLPVYFGDAGSPAVLHLVGAERAACAIIALDTPGANYRAVWAMKKHFPHVKTYVRAHDITHGINLEKAGATAVVPETLEPSLQLAAAVLSELDFQADEVSSIVDDFRRKHLSDLQGISERNGTSLGYGFQREKASGAPVAAAAGDGGAMPLTPALAG